MATPDLAATDVFVADQLTLFRANDYCRWVSCLVEAQNRPYAAADNFALKYPRSFSIDAIQKHASLLVKAPIDPGTSTAVSWAPIAVLAPLSDAFMQLARPASLLGKIPFRRVPFQTVVPVQTGGATYSWVAQAGVKPVGQMAFATVSLPITTCAGILVTTSELLKLTTPASVSALRADLIAGLSQFTDQQLTDPTNPPTPNLSPGSLTFGAPSIGATTDPLADFRKLVSTFIAAGNTGSITVITSPQVLMAILAAANAAAFTGSLFGVSIVTSPAVGQRMIAIDPDAVMLADDDGITIDASTEAAIEMNTVPTSPSTAGTVLVSLWQNNLAGLRVRRFVHWKAARPSAVLYTNTSYS